MRITVSLTGKLLRLARGETLPASALNAALAGKMLSEGVLVTVTRGSRKSYRAQDGKTFRDYLATSLDIRDLEAYHDLLVRKEASRAEQVRVTGNSKTRPHRTFEGFLVNCYEPIEATLAGRSFRLLPEEGSFVFISDFRRFSIPEDIVIIGVENAENFRYIRQQKEVFGTIRPEGAKLLFVSRYPQEQSHDFIEWLKAVPNRYVHFGDLDLAGIHIFLSEYYRHLGERASFLVPPDYEDRIARGSHERYEAQYARFGKMDIPDRRLLPLAECIHRHHRGYDQEGFILSDV